MNSKDSALKQRGIYSEWLVPSFGSFAAALLIWPSFFLVFLPINPIAGFWSGLLITLAIWAGMLSASARIRVIGGELWVAKAHIPAEFLTQGREIEKELRFAERGPLLNQNAFVRFQLGVKPLVRFENTDDRDPSPYWLLATRNPKELIDAIDRAKN